MPERPIIGTRLHGGLAPRACIEFAGHAERAGMASLWFAENPFNRGVLPAVSGCILATSRIRVGIGVWNPYARHPSLIAMEFGALDELAEGRAMLGLGSGIGAAVERMGLSYAKPIAAMRDTLVIVTGLLRGETVTYEGTVFSANKVVLEYKVPNPDKPIYMAAMGDQALRLTGRLAGGTMISNMCPPGYTKRARGLIDEGAAKDGRTPPQPIVQYMPCVIGADRRAARQRVKQTIGRMISLYWADGAAALATRVAMYRESGIPGDEFEAAIMRMRAGEPAEQVLDDRFVDAYSLAGDLDDAAAGMARFAAVGVTEMVLTFVGENPVADMTLLGGMLGPQA